MLRPSVGEQGSGDVVDGDDQDSPWLVYSIGDQQGRDHESFYLFQGMEGP